ncbi:hypothetical protein CYLTODRAFT_422723 [Cylindrobasidium torrendii FP15055 ss-10]|uniref:Secreted protein n=1 Tax=Cylindrobasidium torrendii FP15055 ss-10 TaxID=1314674 RepID=A0A0D7B9L6_9AGAR|nr:hypothetical protein CYLTODRAFT_422723 [Cylindrobasidium torrendii FP15055 ss-10]
MLWRTTGWRVLFLLHGRTTLNSARMSTSIPVVPFHAASLSHVYTRNMHMRISDKATVQSNWIIATYQFAHHHQNASIQSVSGNPYMDA